MSEKMRIGQLANLAGVTPRTVRYYESLGLLGPSERSGTGFRYYTQSTLIRLQKINNLKALGLSLEEIAKVLPLYFEESLQQSGMHRIVELLKQRLQETDEKLAALSHLRADLQTSLDRIQRSLAELPSISDLDSISDLEEMPIRETPEHIIDCNYVKDYEYITD